VAVRSAILAIAWLLVYYRFGFIHLQLRWKLIPCVPSSDGRTVYIDILDRPRFGRGQNR